MLALLTQPCSQKSCIRLGYSTSEEIVGPATHARSEFRIRDQLSPEGVYGRNYSVAQVCDVKRNAAVPTLIDFPLKQFATCPAPDVINGADFTSTTSARVWTKRMKQAAPRSIEFVCRARRYPLLQPVCANPANEISPLNVLDALRQGQPCHRINERVKEYETGHGIATLDNQVSRSEKLADS